MKMMLKKKSTLEERVNFERSQLPLNQSLNQQESPGNLHQTNYMQSNTSKNHSKTNTCKQKSNILQEFNIQTGKNLQKTPSSYLENRQIIILHERLKNIHLFYSMKIQDEKTVASSRNQIFLNILSELETTHQSKLQTIREEILQNNKEKNTDNTVDHEVLNIKSRIDQFLDYSKELKISNDQLQKEIKAHEYQLNEKSAELESLREKIGEAQQELQEFEGWNFEVKKRTKQMYNMMSEIENEIANGNN